MSQDKKETKNVQDFVSLPVRNPRNDNPNPNKRAMGWAKQNATWIPSSPTP